ncbi:MAG: hypothetical protein KF893_25510 [Caldilineaceae bacterium]|nr:hypothetical protein [Caldilineaceae bacterium]
MKLYYLDLPMRDAPAIEEFGGGLYLIKNGGGQTLTLLQNRQIAENDLLDERDDDIDVFEVDTDDLDAKNLHHYRGPIHKAMVHDGAIEDLGSTAGELILYTGFSFRARIVAGPRLAQIKPDPDVWGDLRDLL